MSSYPEHFITLLRDCDAIQIPYGNTITARKGTRVHITQRLGGHFTVQTDHGYLLRVDAKDADALGLTSESLEDPSSAPKHTIPLCGPVEENQLWDLLKTCYDPEIPANIVDLGLIYLCQAISLEDGTSRVNVQMTLTAPGCGMGQVLKDDIEHKLSSLPGVSDVHVELVFDPPWDPSMMTEEARLQLGIF